MEVRERLGKERLLLELRSWVWPDCASSWMTPLGRAAEPIASLLGINLALDPGNLGVRQDHRVGFEGLADLRSFLQFTKSSSQYAASS